MIFNRRDLVAFCGGGVSINKEIPPATVGRTVSAIGGAGGHILGNAENAPRTYTARINLHGQSMADAWALKRKLAAWAWSDGLADLVPTHDPGRKYQAICQSIGDPTFVWGACTVDVVFFIPNPYMLEREAHTYTGSGEASFLNEGTADPLIVVRFVPTTTAYTPVIFLNGDVILSITQDVGAGVPVVADFAAKTLQINGVYALDKINYLNTDWHPEFLDENTIGVEVSDVTVEVINRWL